MQEQPPSEPTRREPADRARRRPARATFTPPTAAEPPAEEASPPAVPASPRPRRAKAAPAVLFQPPEPDRVLPRQTDSTPAAPSPETAAPAGAEGAAPGGAEAEPAARPAKARAPRARKAATEATAVTAPTPPPPTDATPLTPEPVRSPRKRAATPRKATTIKATPPKAAPPKATPRKATSPRATTPKTDTPQPVPEPGPESTPPAVPEAASARTPESDLRAVIARVLDHPGFAPELLALSAVESLGPGAADWAERLRARYPDASADGLARLATRRFVRSAGVGGAAAALAGFFAPLAELASVLWTHSNLVLHLAAAYGRDPAHPDRAVDLLVLTQVHPDPESARAALAAARAADDPVEGAWPRAAAAAWRLAAPLTAQAGGWVALRLAARLLPGAAVLAAALGDTAAADRLAARAVATYRPRQSQSNHSLGSSA
ncbi:hypothetical protein ACIQH6_00070 [Micromonospora orduensis]|uniref:hypothetical protein n=1 Tax=Micromonospora orduensis TaxID=1420891 RepID=UPI0038145EBF